MVPLIRKFERWKIALQALQVDWGDEPDDAQLNTVLQRLHASEYPHAHGRSLQEHLVGTQKILQAWRQPFAIRTAGLFHSAYSTDVYRRRLLDPSERDQLRAVIGEKAERLVYLFGNVPRHWFFEKIFQSALWSAGPLIVPPEISGKENELRLDSSEVFGLVLIHMANEAEQCCLADGKPGLWLARISALGNQGHKAGGLVPSPFDNCTKHFSSDDELLLRESYDRALDGLCSDRGSAAERFAACSQLCPWVGEPFILRAYLKILNKQFSEARQLCVQATKVLAQWGTSWDKRLSFEQWKRLAEVLMDQSQAERIGEISPEFLREPRAFFNRVTSTPRSKSSTVRVPGRKAAAITSNGGSNGGPDSTRLESYIRSFADSRDDPFKATYPGVSSQPWLDVKNFPIVPSLESSYEQVREEILRLPDQDFHNESEIIARKGAWKVLFFYERGKKNIENCSRCPTLTALIEQHETIRTQAGLIYVSRTRPGTHIAPHRGPTNLRVRCHLGIQIPRGDCGLRVNHEIAGWTEGRCIVFDDSYEHESWNYGDGDRIVLILDLWHPGLTPHEREVLKGLHRYASVHAENLHRYWAGNMKAKGNDLSDYH